MGILNIDLNNINVYNNLIKMILILLFFWLGIVKYAKGKALKKELNEELMLIAWHPKRWWNFCL